MSSAQTGREPELDAERDERGDEHGDERREHDAADDVRPDAPERELDEVARELEDVKGRWLRAQADYHNLKKRALLDAEASLRRAMQPLLENLLLVVDHLEMALAARIESEDAQSLAQGVRMTRDQFLRALEDQGVVPVDEAGAFDPNVHQAVATVETTDAQPGTIVATVRRGYVWRGTVLRPAQVRVAAAPANEPSDS